MSDEKIFAEGFKSTPYWWEAAPPGTVAGSPLPSETDCAIVGSGYSGLSCALELARAGVRSVVLDREDIGWGASTRNGGMLSAEPKFADPGTLRRRFGEERAARILEDGRATLANLQEVCEREGIDCELQLTGRFVGAHSPAAYRGLEKKAGALEAEGKSGFELVPRSRQHEVTGTDYYHGGLRFTDGGSLHPALYHRGLAEACRRHGVVFCPGTEVLGMERLTEDTRAPRFRVHTARGAFESREAVLGTNGYTGTATPWHRRRLVPLGSFIIATEALIPGQVEQMFRGFCTMSNTQRILFYYRPSPDHRRVVFGGRASFRKSEPARASSVRLHRYLCEVFPQLRGVRITHGWSERGLHLRWPSPHGRARWRAFLHGVQRKRGPDDELSRPENRFEDLGTDESALRLRRSAFPDPTPLRR